MMNLKAQTQGGRLLHKGWELAYDAVELLILLIFAGVSLFPAHALAFNNDLEQSHLKLIFTLDPALEGIAVVGIEEYPKPKTFARVLKDDSLDVRASLIAGSKVRVLSLAYSSTLDQTDANPYITANGARVGPGTMAANFLPLGTSVRIGNMIYVINDRMNERFNNKYVVDIWKPTRQEAINHGARILEMEIVSLP